MISKKDAQKWIDALRSGEYIQTHGLLQDKDGYCCLGVACKLFIPHDQLEMKMNSNYISGGNPADQTNCPEWLMYIDRKFNNKTKSGFVTLNDNERFTFDEIADCIQAVYIEGVLDEETK